MISWLRSVLAIWDTRHDDDPEGWAKRLTAIRAMQSDPSIRPPRVIFTGFVVRG